MSVANIEVPVKHPELVLWAILIGLIVFLISYLVYIKIYNKRKANEIKERIDGDERYSKVSIEERSKSKRRFSNK